MAVKTAREIARSLSKKGFVREKGGSHILYRLWVDGKKTGINTPVSPKEEYTRDLLNLIECPMTGEAYLKKLRGKSLHL